MAEGGVVVLGLLDDIQENNENTILQWDLSVWGSHNLDMEVLVVEVVELLVAGAVVEL